MRHGVSYKLFVFCKVCDPQAAQLSGQAQVTMLLSEYDSSNKDQQGTVPLNQAMVFFGLSVHNKFAVVLMPFNHLV